MKILIAPDKFKGSLSAQAVCEAIGNGLKHCKKQNEIVFHPMADGGDGSVAVLARYLSLEKQFVKTADSLGRPIEAEYFTSAEAAFIEVASASGLVLLSPEERNPLRTSTQGTGKMIENALSKGYEQIYLFLGGSATNDAGMGIASALGCLFFDHENKVLAPVGENLPKVAYIRFEPSFDVQEIKITLLCDVANTLFGIGGAARVYARQKGATDDQLKYLDQGLKHFSTIIQQQTGIDVSRLPGSGAAGGIAASLIAFFNAKIVSGFDRIAKLTGLEQQIQSVDLVISGEGKLDTQSLQGKVVRGVSTLCKKHKKPLILLVGKNELTAQSLSSLSASQVLSITENAKNTKDAMSNAAVYLEGMAFKLFCH